MKIGINARFLRKPGTGIGQVTREFLRTLARDPDASKHSFILYVEEMPVLDFPLPVNWEIRPISPWYGRDDLIREHIWERFTLPQNILRDGCEVFFSPSQSATILPPSIQHVMFVHDLVPLRFTEYLRNIRQRVHYHQVLRAIRSATSLITPSNATKQDLVEMLKISEDRIGVALLGPPSIFQDQNSADSVMTILAKYQLERGYIYHGGGMEKRKNTALLIEAYAALVSEGHALPPLVISGMIHSPRNPLATNVPALVKKFHLEKKVRLLGFVPEADLPGLYSGAVFFVYPSEYEGFGLPLLEAFASGTPVLTNEAASLPEVAGTAALYCHPMDTGHLKEKILTLLSNEKLREELRSAGRERVKNFSWESCTRRILSLLLQ